jgi:hypothetical protein
MAQQPTWWDKTPHEAHLEQQLADAKRHIAYLEDEHKSEFDFERLKTDPQNTLVLDDLLGQIVLYKTAEIRATVNAYGALKVEARTHGNAENLHFATYLNELSGGAGRRQPDLIARLYKRVLLELAGHYK